MNVLSIGNSFAVDAHRYLHQIAKADGVELTTVALDIQFLNVSVCFNVETSKNI